MPLFSSYFNNNEKRPWLFAAIALFLAGAQLLTQLHSLEHIENHDDIQLKHGCDICILSADLENSSPATNATPIVAYPSSTQHAPTLSTSHSNSLQFGFNPRAPPALLQLS